VELTLDLQTGNATVEASLAGSGSEFPLCGASGPDRFYAVSSRGGLSASVVALDGGTVDVAVLSACPTAPVSACQGSVPNSASVTARYLVAVTSPAGDADPFSLSLSGQAPAQGDGCAQPLVLSPLQLGRTSTLTTSFSGITRGHTERDNPCAGMFTGSDRRDVVFAVDVQVAGKLSITVDPTVSSFSSTPDVGVGLSSGADCASATAAGACVNAIPSGFEESLDDVPVVPGTWFIWVSAAAVTSGNTARVAVTAKLR
jgi:hypothetical protein